LIRIFSENRKHRLNKKETISIIKGVLKYESSKEGEINIIFVNDRYIRKMNTTFLKHNWATDVISFPLSENQKIEGEVYINLEQAKRQAEEYKSTLKTEIQRLVIHGILHLIGYTDNNSRGKKRMSNIEDKYLNLFCKKN
jgi:probable rRNA maturation factor